MKYICTNCNYIYDESIWEKEDWIETWTIFWQLWDHFCCPNCLEDKDFFHELIEEVNYIEKENIYDFMQNDHFINIEEKNDIIKVIIWKELHPSWEDHKIIEISLYDEYSELVENKFINQEKNPIVKFDISTLDDYEIRARCSIHWLWWIKVKRSD